LFAVKSDTGKEHSKEAKQNNSKTEVETEIMRPTVWVYWCGSSNRDMLGKELVVCDRTNRHCHMEMEWIDRNK
jgi:hypothetical protein